MSNLTEQSVVRDNFRVLVNNVCNTVVGLFITCVPNSFDRIFRHRVTRRHQRAERRRCILSRGRGWKLIDARLREQRCSILYRSKVSGQRAFSPQGRIRVPTRNRRIFPIRSSRSRSGSILSAFERCEAVSSERYRAGSDDYLVSVQSSLRYSLRLLLTVKAKISLRRRQEFASEMLVIHAILITLIETVGEISN